MLLLTIPIAVLLGLWVGKNIEVEKKSHKFLIVFLAPLITGFVINSIAALAKNSVMGFWFDYGQSFIAVAIPEIALLITLLVCLKVKEEMPKEEIEKNPRSRRFQYRQGEETIEVEVELTEQEIAKLDELRKQDPERWKENDYELVKEVKRQLSVKQNTNEFSKKTDDTEPDGGPVPDEKIIVDAPVEKQTVELKQNGIVVKMELPHEVLEQMESLRQQNPEQWNDNEVELVKAAKRKLQGIGVVYGAEKKDNAVEPSAEEKAAADAPKGAFGGKLESEFRRETKADAHWIRQDGTDICINIEDAVYQRMIEMQNENPKKWVNKELDLYQRAKKGLMEGDTKKGLFRKK